MHVLGNFVHWLHLFFPIWTTKWWFSWVKLRVPLNIFFKKKSTATSPSYTHYLSWWKQPCSVSTISALHWDTQQPHLQKKEQSNKWRHGVYIPSCLLLLKPRQYQFNYNDLLFLLNFMIHYRCVVGHCYYNDSHCMSKHYAKFRKIIN
jgi:hypothetical protein